MRSWEWRLDIRCAILVTKKREVTKTVFKELPDGKVIKLFQEAKSYCNINCNFSAEEIKVEKSKQ